jgi:hypothetical protein
MKRPTPVGQLLGKSKWEKHFPDWIMATGVGLLGSEFGDFGANGWKEMTDGDVSHLSKIKFLTFRTVAVLDLLSLWIFSSFQFTLFLHLVCLFRLLFLYQEGLIPRMGQTHC